MLPRSQHPPVEVEHGWEHGLVPQQAAPTAVPQQFSVAFFSGLIQQAADMINLNGREKEKKS